MFVEKDGKYAVECHTKVARNCSINSDYFETEEEAEQSVEDDCWIFTGEGWFCVNCNAHFMENLTKHRKKFGLDGSDDDLEKGINTVR